MARFFLPPDCWHSEAVLLNDEARHLSQVLRIRPGETITVFDGKGCHASAEVGCVSRDRVEIRLGEISAMHAPKPRITLALAIPKGKNMDLIVQKSVELGVASIQPLLTRNTVVQPGEGKPDKWRRIALEACKQCGQDSLPEIASPMDVVSWLAGFDRDNSLRIIASLASGSAPLRDTLLRFPGTERVTLLVGPEGDFTPDETRLALGAGFLPVTLGEIILRVETAALFGVSAIRYQFG